MNRYTIKQLNKFKSAAENKTRAKVISMKNFQDKETPQELFSTTRQKTKIRNVFATNILTSIISVIENHSVGWTFW